MALQLLVEGNSLRSTERITGLDINTLMKILLKAGEKCEKMMGRILVNIAVKDVQCDEIWGYFGKKEAHKLPMESDDDSIGDAYCFVAIERTTKLVLNFALGRRTQETTDTFIEGLRAATAPQRFQLSADGFHRTSQPSPRRCPTAATSHNSSRFTSPIPMGSAGTARPMPRIRSESQSWVTLILRRFAPATWSARISRFACRCAASPG